MCALRCAAVVTLVAAAVLCARASTPREWSVSDLPYPLNDKEGLCNRDGRPSTVCNPDRLLSDRAARDIDEMVADTEARNARVMRDADGKRGNKKVTALAVVVLNTIRLGNMSVEEGSRRFADELQASWRPESRCDIFAVLLVVKMHGQVQFMGGDKTPQPHNLKGVLNEMRVALMVTQVDDAVKRGVHRLTHANSDFQSPGVPERNASSNGPLSWFLVLPQNDSGNHSCSVCSLNSFLSFLTSVVIAVLHFIYGVMSWLVWMVCCVLVYLILFEVLRACVRAFIKSHNSGRRRGVVNPWVHASFISSELASRDRTYKHCKQAVLRIERDRENARCGAHLPICCPLCLEDFDPGSSEAVYPGSPRIDGASAARLSATDEMTSGHNDVESQGGDGEESQPLLSSSPHGLHTLRAFDAARSGSTNASMANFALAVSSDVTLLVLLVMARSTFDVGHERALDVSFPSTTVSLRCGHHFHTKCLTPMLLVVQDLCPVCLSNLFQTRVARGWDWDSFYDEYMFRVRRVRRLYAAHVSDDMERRWLNVTPHARNARADPPMVRDFEFRRLDGDSSEAVPGSASVPPS
jgi:hypothetical protein